MAILNTPYRSKKNYIMDENEKWRSEHKDCPGRIYGNNECSLSRDYCTEKNCIIMYFKRKDREGTIDSLFDIL